MIMAGLEFIGDIPFRDVYIHGTVRDIEGKKMSKSLGNIIDPLEIINEFGADALRFSLISITAQGQDVFLSRERFEQGRNFANKIWNASRFILMNLGPDQNNQDPSLPLKQEGLSLENCWILSRLNCVLKEANADLGAFKFNEAANLLYGFFWHEFCDWYLELIKPVLEKKENSRDYGNTQIVMHAVLEKSLRLLHPFMPFVTEELWQRLNQRLTTSAEGGSACGGNDKRPTTSIMVQPWPQVQEQLIDKRCEKKMAALFEVITAIRNMRSELEIPIQEEIPVTVYPGHKTIKELIASCAPLIKNLTRAKELIIQDSYIRKEGEFVTALKNMHIAMALSGIIDIAAQRKKTEEKIIAAETEIRQKKALLENKAFIGNAPPEIVEKERAKLEELNGLVKKLKAVKDALR
jgi:valyl-tRNA synthetase